MNSFFKKLINIRDGGEKAEEIVNKYGKALASGSDGIARKMSLLPYPKDEIKQAFFTYIEVLIKNDLLEQEVEESLVTAYSAIDSFIDDEIADEINIIHVRISMKDKTLTEEQMKNYFDFVKNKMLNLNNSFEITNFIAKVGKSN